MLSQKDSSKLGTRRAIAMTGEKPIPTPVYQQTAWFFLDPLEARKALMRLPLIFSGPRGKRDRAARSEIVFDPTNMPEPGANCH